jgi:hypothetical protein
MDWTSLNLNTFVPEMPQIINNNFSSFKRYLDIIYNETTGVVVVPVNTTGRVKAATGEFVNAIVDNLTVKKQYVNMYSNVTTVDLDYYNTYIGGDVSTRDASTWENSDYEYVDVVSPYYKILNDTSYAFTCSTLGQEFQIIFDVSSGTSSSPFNILLDPSYYGTTQTIQIEPSVASYTWLKLIAVDYDASFGTVWKIKQMGGNITIV